MEEQTVPSRRKCGAIAAHYLIVEANPDFRERLRELEDATAQRMAFGMAARRVEGPATIPTVVHVVYNEESGNISEAQIESQISVLNQDFRAQNPDSSKVPEVWEGLVADANIQFALASEDPNGGTTTGITRTRTEKTAFHGRPTGT